MIGDRTPNLEHTLLTLGTSGLGLAVLLGAILLAPALRAKTRVPRTAMATAHGLFGATALALCVFGLGRAGMTELGLAAAALGGAGLACGGAVFAATRHRASPPVLLLALHVIFAGIGAVLFAGLVLG